MSWEILQRMARSASTEWRMSVKSTGITLWVPQGHAFETHAKVETHLGRKEHEGLIRIVPSDSPNARAVYKSQKKGAGSASVKYSTLPGAPKNLDSTTVSVREVEGGGIEFRLPWVKVTETPNFAAGRSDVAVIGRTKEPTADPEPLKRGGLPAPPTRSVFDKKPVPAVVSDAARFALGDRARVGTKS